MSFPVKCHSYITQRLADLSLFSSFNPVIIYVDGVIIICACVDVSTSLIEIRNILNKEVKMVSYYESAPESMRIGHNNSNQLETSYVSIISGKCRLRKTVSKI